LFPLLFWARRGPALKAGGALDRPKEWGNRAAEAKMKISFQSDEPGNRALARSLSTHSH